MEKSNTSCCVCGKEFYKIPARIKRSIKHYCSKVCHNKGQHTGIALQCSNCQKDIYRTKSQYLRFENHFCSSSCSASFNNRNKTFGITRSKLEIYLEEQLRNLYPNLSIICNSKKEIGSELDFYFPDLMLAIELNGIVHYEPIYGASKLDKIKNNDHMKFLNCHNKGIELAVIDTSSCGHLTANSKDKYLKIVINLIEPILNRLNS